MQEATSVLLRPPFSEAARAYLEDALLADLRRVVREHTSEVADTVWARWARLRDPNSPEYLLNQLDYCCVK